jgi:hypothetical protein
LKPALYFGNFCTPVKKIAAFFWGKVAFLEQCRSHGHARLPKFIDFQSKLRAKQYGKFSVHHHIRSSIKRAHATRRKSVILTAFGEPRVFDIP